MSWPVLRFRQDGGFRIVQFTDIHWHEHRDMPKAAKLIKRAQQDLNPDFVAYTGDNIVGGNCKDPLASIREVFGILASEDLPWTFVFGNHDDEGSASRQELFEAASELPGFAGQAGPEDLPGVGNQYLEVSSSRGKAPARLYFLDSHSYAPDLPNGEKGGYAWIEQEQTDWVLGKLPVETDPQGAGLLFFHIPTPEWAGLAAGKAYEGQCGEEVCCPKKNSGLIDALAREGGIHGIFVGHDHLNDYVGVYKGIQLGYGRVTGYACYPDLKRGFQRGARVFDLKDGEREFKTWVWLDPS